MPSLTSYTPFETLKLCQSIVQHGSDAAAFRDIAAALNASDLIRESATYDEKRFTAAALHGLYDELVRQESGDSPKVNGDVASSSPRKRKLSTSPQPNGDHNEELVHSLVEKLYARFREEAIKEIRRDEEEYVQLQEEIREMEKQPQPSPSEVEPSQAPESSKPDAAAQVVPTQGQPAPNQDGPPLGQPLNQLQRPQPQVHPPPESYPPPSATQNPQQQQQQVSPAPYNHGLPPQSPRQPGQPGFQQQPLPPQHGYPAGPQSHPQMMPYAPGMHQMPPPVDYTNPNRKGSSSTSTPARGSPVPPHQQQFTPYQQPYHPGPPQWPHPYPPPNAYPPHMYPNQQYYIQSPSARQHPHYQTPHQPPYQPYPQTAPVPYQPPQGWQPSPSHSPYPQAHSTSATPIANLQRMQIARVSGSSTPWKRRQLPPNTAPPLSPRRPERSISPVSDTEDVPTPLPATSKNARSSRKEPTPKREPAQTRRGRPPSVAASGRSQSVASRSSEAAGTEKPDLRKPTDIKMEAPSTPLPVTTSTDAPSTAEQRSSGRRGRPRNNTTTSRPDVPRSTTNNKRKRSEPDSSTPPPTVNRVTGHHNPLYPTDPSLVVASKNFAKTTQIMLNDITSHKLAGVFAKPLSERDAPGYKDLILRPQDLKSIKTAAGRGSRAAVAAIEALEDNEDADEAGMDTSEPTEEKEGLRGNGVFLVKKTDDLVPPRGIANSAQLELELMRVFANAIMFNPLPQTERGFGRNLRLRKRGGDVVSTERDGDEDGSAEEGEEQAGSTTSSEDSEGEADTGIITDAREMFEDVYAQVKGWRELERERQRGDGFGSGAGGAEGEKTRQESVASVVEDTRATASTPTAASTAKESTDEGRGTLRKRRKIAE